MLALTGTDARRWEPKRLRLRLFSVAGTIARRSRRVWLHLSGHAPHRHLFTIGLARLITAAAPDLTCINPTRPAPGNPHRNVESGTTQVTNGPSANPGPGSPPRKRQIYRPEDRSTLTRKIEASAQYRLLKP